MKRRLLLTNLVSAATTFGVGYVAILATAEGDSQPVAALSSTSGNPVEVLQEYIVVRSSASTTTTTTAATTTTTTTSIPLVVDPVPVALDVAGTPTLTEDFASAPTEPVVPVASVPHTMAPSPPPTVPAEPPSVPVTPEPAAEPTTAPAEQPPIPEGCIEPEFRRGKWVCDDD